MTRLIFAPLKFCILASEFQKYITQSVETIKYEIFQKQIAYYQAQRQGNH